MTIAEQLELELEYAKLREELEEERREDTMGDFRKWSSTPRWHKGLTITEKIDGTNACIVVYDGQVKAQSRNRMITPDNDNAGFAKWVYENAGALTDTLGYGYHYGEWYGEGIQKNPLGIEGKRFALFHATKYTQANGYLLEDVDGLETVPLLFQGQANLWTVSDILQQLQMYGTKVQGAKTTDQPYFFGPGSMTYKKAADAEGIIVWHKETQQKYKILLKEDAFHKWEVK